MLDPKDWEHFRTQAHRALDDAIDYLRDVRERPVWQPVPEAVKEHLRAPMPQEGAPFENVYEEFVREIFPYATGNVHPRFWGWVHGTGTPGGMIADMLAASMNSNAGGRDHGAIYVERQIVRWFADLFTWPPEAAGIVVNGTSAANFNAVVTARVHALGQAARDEATSAASRLIGYASRATHGCVRKAFECAGLGAENLRVLPIDAQHRIDPERLKALIERDRAAGLRPFLVVGNAGTVDVGAIDPLDALADLCAREKLWFHVDGAFGAMAYLSERLRPMLSGIERADSLAFDFHKWLHVPYDAACVLVRDGETQRAAFASEGPYLTRMDRGLAAGAPWFADFGLDLSRGFRALKVWFTVKEHGAKGLAAAIERNCAQAEYLAEAIRRDDRFELAAPVPLNIVCFRPRIRGKSAEELDRITDEAVIALQESGAAVISSTTIDGRRAMRCCITNHRSTEADFDVLLRALASVLPA